MFKWLKGKKKDETDMIPSSGNVPSEVRIDADKIANMNDGFDIIMVNKLPSFSETQRMVEINTAGTRFSAILSNVPAIASNAISAAAMSQPLYSITFNGKKVLPQELFQKKNEALISNLKTITNKFGKQTDINPADLSLEAGVAVVVIIYQIMAIITQQKYLDNINKGLNEIQRGINQILIQMDDERTSRIEGHVETLERIARDFDSIQDNEKTVALELSKLALVQQEECTCIGVFEKELEREMQTLMQKKEEMADQQDRDRLFAIYKRYCFCMNVFAYSKIIELMLTENRSHERFEAVLDELKAMKKKQTTICEQLTTRIDDHNFNSKQAKNMMEPSWLEKAAKDVFGTPVLSWTGVKEAIEKGQVERNHELTGLLADHALIIPTAYSGELLDPFISIADQLELVHCHDLQVYGTREKLYVYQAD